MEDITNEWEKVPEEKTKSVINLTGYEVDGVVYKVDGRCVFLDYSVEERMIADVIAREYGRSIFMVPKILFTQKIRMPDYLIDGKRYDLKTPTGVGKNTIYDLVRKGKTQADNFIICLDKTRLDLSEVEKQLRTMYSSRHTGDVNVIILVKNENIIKVFRR